MQFTLEEKIEAIYKVNCETLSQVDPKKEISQIKLYVDFNAVKKTKYVANKSRLDSMQFKTHIKGTLLTPQEEDIYYLYGYDTQNKKNYDTYKLAIKLFRDCKEKEELLNIIYENLQKISEGIGFYYEKSSMEEKQQFETIKNILNQIDENIKNLTNEIYYLKSEGYFPTESKYIFKQ